MFNRLAGAALLIAAGWLWYALGPTATFLAGVIFSTLAALIIATTRKLGGVAHM